VRSLGAVNGTRVSERDGREKELWNFSSVFVFSLFATLLSLCGPEGWIVS
jgi:hypothetical protein